MPSDKPLTCREPAIPTVQVDTRDVRVTRWDFAPGAETGWHRHGYTYVVVPVTDGTLLVEMAGSQSVTSELKAGVSYTRQFGVEHNVVNAGAAPLSFVETEILALQG